MTLYYFFFFRVDIFLLQYEVCMVPKTMPIHAIA